MQQLPEIHTAGTAKLILNSTITPGKAAYTKMLGGCGRDVNMLNKGDQVWTETSVHASSTKQSFYPGMYFYCWDEGYANMGQIDIEVFRNVDYVYYVLFKVSDDTNIGAGIPEGTNSEFLGKKYNEEVVGSYPVVEISAPYQIHGNPSWKQTSIGYQQLGDPDPAPEGIFSGTKWINKGMYLLIMCPVPLNKSQPATVGSVVWSGPGWPKEGGRYANWTIYSGWYPMKTVVIDPENSKLHPNNSRLGITEKERSARYVMSCGLLQYVKGETGTTAYAYKSPGVLQSMALHTSYGIATATVDVNLNLPENTYYALEVSNDGGNKFFKVQGRQHTFTTTTGQDFIWRLTLYSNDDSKTPMVYYDNNDKYAIKAVLGLTGGNITDGCLVTEPFDGNQIVKDELKLATNQFSHWEWARLWASGPRNAIESTEEGRTMFVDIEASNDGTNWIKKISSLYLDDLYHGSIDYSNYVGSFDADEYNYNLDVDFDTETNTVPIWDLNEEGTTGIVSYDTDSITITAGTKPNPNYTSSTLSSPANFGVDDIHVTGSVGGFKVLAFKNIADMNLSNEKQLHLWFACDKAMGEGDLELCLYKENLTAEGNIPEPFEVHPLPQIPQDTANLMQAVLQLTSPISDLRDFKSLGIRLARTEDPESTEAIVPFHLFVGPIEKISSKAFPLYERYLRLRVCMHRDLASLESPSVRKVGVVPIIT